MLRWYVRHGRDFPWRKTTSPYAILVSEVMLQQTGTARVILKYLDFLSRCPTAASLAAASLKEVLTLWSGLGYNGRARNLWNAMRRIRADRGGRLPRSTAALRRLPGIGRYTSAAVACFAYNARVPIVDTNVRRVLSRSMLGLDDCGERKVWQLADALLPARAAKSWNQGLMDIGAIFCRPRPKCAQCPAKRHCRWAASGMASIAAKRATKTAFWGSSRFYRGRIVRALVEKSPLRLIDLGVKVKQGFDKTELAWLAELVVRLESDGLVKLDRLRQRARLA